MKDKSKLIVLCALMLAILGSYYAIAFIFVAINLLGKELHFAIEHSSMGVYLHIIFIFFVHILAVFLFIYSAIGVLKLNNIARKLAIIITGLNLFTIFTPTSGWPMLSLKIFIFIISLLTLYFLFNKKVREKF